MIVKNKTQMYTLLKAGRFGPPWPNYESIEAVPDSVKDSTFMIRNQTVQSDPITKLSFTFDELSQKFIPGIHKISPHAPDHRILLQGELMRSNLGLVLNWNTEKNLRMPEAMGRAQTYTQLQAKFLLLQSMDENDYERLMDLLDEFPDSVVEFAAYEITVMGLSTRLVVWEVRNY